MSRPRKRRKISVLLVGALLLVSAPSYGQDPQRAAEHKLELAVQEYAKQGTLKGQLIQLGEFDDNADVCPLTPDKLTKSERRRLVRRGRQLFRSTTAFSQQPSQGPSVADTELACINCHAGKGRTDGRVHLVGPTENRDLVPRHTPHLLNIADAAPYGWDGRFQCLQAVIKGAIMSPLEMHAAREPKQEQLDALAAFVETLDAPEATPGVDYDPELAKLGERLFQQYRGIDLNGDFTPFDGVACIHCHAQPRGTDLKFHPILLPPPLLDVPTLDPGHVDSNGDIRGFKTPVLRGVRLTAPYFHDGSMGVAGGGVPSQDQNVAALMEMMEAYRARFFFDFTPDEELAIVHYLLSL